MKQWTQQAAPPSPKWLDMTPRQRLIYVVRLTVCILSFGFIFPNIND